MPKKQGPPRDANGKWLPGAVPNPAGRPRTDHSTVKALARGWTEDAVATLAEIMNNPKASHSSRVSAANALLDRGWGKPKVYEDEDLEKMVRRQVRFVIAGQDDIPN